MKKEVVKALFDAVHEPALLMAIVESTIDLTPKQKEQIIDRFNDHSRVIGIGKVEEGPLPFIRKMSIGLKQEHREVIEIAMKFMEIDSEKG